jgi:hypothetical protein
MVFVPEGPCDRSLARSAWDIANPREPSRTGRIFRGTLPRHFVPGYDRVVPTGRKYILRAEALIKLALMG